MWIFAEFPGKGASNNSIGLSKTAIFNTVLLIAISSEALEVKDNVIIRCTLTTQYMTVNNLEWTFHVKFCFFVNPSSKFAYLLILTAQLYL